MGFAENFEDLQIWQRSRVLTNEIYDAFEKIRDYDFAEIREFIDIPLQSYSSGMTVRLGFAVATAMEPAFEIVKNRQHRRLTQLC